MRTKAFLLATAAFVATATGAEAQTRPGQYGGGLFEYLMAGRAGPVQRPLVRTATPPVDARIGVRAAGAPVAARTASYQQLEPGAAPPMRVAALTPERFTNPYEDADPIAYGSPATQPARPNPYRAAAVARAPDPQFMRQVVPYTGKQRTGTIVIDTGSRHLYLVQGDGTAIRYGIGVGRPGFLWHGIKSVSAKKEWPDWTPPKEMLARRPDLPTFMVGGVENPLGARALYLGSSLYRIHGTNEPNTIGQAVSSGCIRMMNDDVVDLYERTPVGTRVEVI